MLQFLHGLGVRAAERPARRAQQAPRAASTAGAAGCSVTPIPVCSQPPATPTRMLRAPAPSDIHFAGAVFWLALGGIGLVIVAPELAAVHFL